MHSLPIIGINGVPYDDLPEAEGIKGVFNMNLKAMLAQNLVWIENEMEVRKARRGLKNEEITRVDMGPLIHSKMEVINEIMLWGAKSVS